MERNRRTGFAVLELIVVIVLVIAILGVGYYVWHNRKSAVKTTHSSTVSTTSKYQSPTTVTPLAPQVNNSADLNAAMQALNQTSISSSNIDSSQLSTQANGF